MPMPPGYETYSFEEAAAQSFEEDEVMQREFEEFLRAQGANTASSSSRPKNQSQHGFGKSQNGRGLASEANTKVEITDWRGATISDPQILEHEAKFEDLIRDEKLLQGIYELGFVKPSKIQAGALPRICRRKDGALGQNMIGQAQNGSGKTATFALGLLTAINVEMRAPQALVMCPTRELAMQNDWVISNLGKFLPVETLLLIPSQDRIPKHKPCHVLIGTPGKTQDLVKKGVVDLSNICVFVLDEADMMLDQENQMGSQVQTVRSFMPKDCQVLFFSATYPDEVRHFANSLAPAAVSIQVKKTELTVSSVAQMYVKCHGDDEKLEKLKEMYAAMNVGQSIVFVNRRQKAFALAKDMRSAGHAVSLICGTQTEGEERMDPALRDQIMGEFRRGITKVLISTDVLSRGIDVPQVTLVVNFEMPVNYHFRGADFETYLHRVGRTGRFGLKGVAVNLVTDAEKSLIDEVCSFFACSIPEMDMDAEALEAHLQQLR